MIKLTSVNKDFFKSKKPLVLVTTAILGVSIVASSFASIHAYKNSNDKKYYFAVDENSEEPWNPEDLYVWQGIVPEHTELVTFTYLPSNVYKYKVIRGKSQMTHYRIEIDDEDYSDWQEIPKDGLIQINREDFLSKNRYGTYKIQYGYYDENLGEIVSGGDKEKKLAIMDWDTLKEVERYNSIRNIMIDEFQKLIDASDTEFDKVKKAYDFIIEYTAYNHDYHGPDYINSKGVYMCDCTGYTDITNAILNSVGVECFSVIDYSNGHIWNIVKVDDKYYHLDATYSDTGSWTHTSKYRYFLVSDEYMQEENRWFIKEYDVECNKMYDLSGIVRRSDVKYRGLN